MYFDPKDFVSGDLLSLMFKCAFCTCHSEIVYAKKDTIVVFLYSERENNPYNRYWFLINGQKCFLFLNATSKIFSKI